MKKLLLNIVILLTTLIALVIITLLALHSYTRQDQAIEVPNIKGLDINNAVPFIESAQLTYDVIDSVFDKRGIPGTIKETIPTAGSKVKQGRKIFVTTYAYGTQTGVIPTVSDISLRQVQATLEGLGFESVRTEYVAGQFKDLVIGLKANGKVLTPGERLPLSAPIHILVSSGGSINSNNDALDLTQDESWF